MGTISKRHGEHAIVIGASISGLLAARVLADYFEKVTLLERDSLPDTPEFRSGVPQGHHLHILMIRGQQSLYHYFPNLLARFEAAGVPHLRWLQDCRLYFEKGWLPKDDIGLTTRSCSRPRIEYFIRQELAAYPNVCFRGNCAVTQLLAQNNKAGRNKQVKGVQIEDRPNAKREGHSPDVMPADFVVDASGRDTHSPQWLVDLGYPRPGETVVNSFLGYTSRAFRHLSSDVDWKTLVIAAQPPHQPRGGVIALLEGGQWLVLLSGANKYYPPTDEQGFLEFARKLASPLLYEAIRDGEPSSPIYGYQRTANVMRHYERSPRWPERFAVFGDAVCCFNPAYGQGMTVSALAAETLDRCLAEVGNIDDLGQRFQKRVAQTNQLPWLMATGADFQYLDTEGKRPGQISKLAQLYLWRLQELMPSDVEIAKTFLEVLNMVAPPTALFKPALFLQVIRDALRTG